MKDVYRKRFLMLLALIGFCTQVIQMSILYFEYKTTTQVTLVLHDMIVKHQILMCIRYGDILNRNRFHKDTGRWVKQIIDLDEALEEESSITVRQIFDYTPAAEDTIEACFYRTSTMTFSVSRRYDCNSRYNVTKVFTLEFMCYKFDPIQEVQLETSAATQARYKQYTIFDLTFTQDFETADYIVPIVYSGKYPYVSRKFSESAIIRSKSETIQGYNWINIFNNDFTIYRLEAPYNTRCIRRPYDEYFSCRRHCLVNYFIQHFNKVPVTEFLDHKYDLLPITTNELRNPESSRLVQSFYDNCFKSCHFIPCFQSYTKTSFRTILFKNFSFAVSAMTPSEPDIETQSQATMSFVEYFSFITGCFGTWFGLHFLSLDSCRWIKNERRKQRERRQQTSGSTTHWIFRPTGERSYDQN